VVGAHRIIEHAPRLTELDARIGDGDHGINLARGMTLVRDAMTVADDEEDAPELLRQAGRMLISSVGGASGPLYGTLLLESGEALTAAAGIRALGVALERGVAGVGRRGRSIVGQKTMLDTLVPAAAALAGDGEPMAAVSRAIHAARAGCESTRDMIAQRGRASYLGERSVGHLDPGAVSSLLLVEALGVAAGLDQPPASSSSAPSR
jgi:dihydroxyacetone kinase-like protein